jgi:hypothetical protein
MHTALGPSLMILSQISRHTLMMIIPRHAPLLLHPVPLVLHPIRPCTPCNPWLFHVNPSTRIFVHVQWPLILLRFNKGTWTVVLWSALQINSAFCGIIRILWILASNCVWPTIPHIPHKALGIFVSLLIPQWVRNNKSLVLQVVHQIWMLMAHHECRVVLQIIYDESSSLSEDHLPA